MHNIKIAKLLCIAAALALINNFCCEALETQAQQQSMTSLDEILAEDSAAKPEDQQQKSSEPLPKSEPHVEAQKENNDEISFIDENGNVYTAPKGTDIPNKLRGWFYVTDKNGLKNIEEKVKAGEVAQAAQMQSVAQTTQTAQMAQTQTVQPAFVAQQTQPALTSAQQQTQLPQQPAPLALTPPAQNQQQQQAVSNQIPQGPTVPFAQQNVVQNAPIPPLPPVAPPSVINQPVQQSGAPVVLNGKQMLRCYIEKDEKTGQTELKCLPD
ncbi:hypothetical protein FACS1894113_5330 [Alphaproteobacteria bacterium]|nr:hypothetical protein FACS1894113_5330 [Alphaproteobacteria bacterium]